MADIDETTPVDIDHVGFAVDDAASMLRRLNADGLLLPVAGEEESDFRYVIGRRGRPARGVRIELLDPRGNPDSFLARFIRRHGQGAHHVTFMVADFERTVARARDAGLPVTQVDSSYPPWREAFIHPQGGIGSLVQIASSIHSYPNGSDTGGPVDPLSVPHRRSGTNRDWWRHFIEKHGGPEPVVVEGLTMGVPDESSARTLFGQVLGGKPERAERPGRQRFTWPSGYVDVAQSAPPYIALWLQGHRGPKPHRYTIGGTELSTRNYDID